MDTLAGGCNAHGLRCLEIASASATSHHTTFNLKHCTVKEHPPNRMATDCVRLAVANELNDLSSSFVKRIRWLSTNEISFFFHYKLIREKLIIIWRKLDDCGSGFSIVTLYGGYIALLARLRPKYYIRSFSRSLGAIRVCTTLGNMV